MEQDIKTYYLTMKVIHRNLLEFLDNESESDQNFEKLITSIKEKNIHENRYDLKSIFHLIVNISNNHHRSLQFFEKIEQILSTFSSEIKRYYSNDEIYDIFKDNKRVLLFVIESKLLTVDQRIADLIENHKYRSYRSFFVKEIQPFAKDTDGKANAKILEALNKSLKENPNNEEQDTIRGIIGLLNSKKNDKIKYEKDPIQFEKNRHEGENENEICRLIRNDSLDDFISYVNVQKISDKKIPFSIFESNQYLLKNEPSLIEYAAFFGSLKIFKYLLVNNSLLDYPLWEYAIHGRNTEIIHLLEEKELEPPYCAYDVVELEAVKCHHNEIASYINENYMKFEISEDERNDLVLKKQKYIKNGVDYLNEEEDIEKFYGFSRCYKWYNFDYMKFRYVFDPTSFFYFCKYDYFQFVNYFLQTKSIDTNDRVVLKKIFVFIAFQK